MSSPPTSELRAVADALRERDRFLLVAHENPDGDALGSILALKLGLDALGKDSVMFLGGDTGIPQDYELLSLEALRRELPPDAAERVLVALDCASALRMGLDPALLERVPLSLDVDHHHDNTHFAGINLVVPDASSTGEIVRDLLRELKIPLTPQIAEALYVALVTDTGRFQYTNTTPDSHRMAADLMELGVDVHGVFRQLFENVPFIKIQLLARVLERVERYDDGRLTISFISRSDYEEFGADESLSEGIVDHIRAIEGTTVAALVREQLKSEREGIRKVSLRTADDAVDVSVIARQENGGGHRQAAGFSTEQSSEELVAWLRAEIAAQVEAPAH